MSEMFPLVTIRCLVYNHEPYLRQCLEGFVMQKTNFPFEAIVHDDASTDGSAAIIREYAEKYPDIIKPIYETENQYSKHDGSLRRKMDVHMRGKYIAMCEGDDYWIDPHKLQKQVDFLETHPQYVLSHTNIVVYDNHSKKYIRRHFNGIDGNICEFLITRGNPIATVTVCMRQCIWTEYRKESQYWNLKVKMGDLPLWIYASTKGLVHYMPETTSVYRLLSNSASHNSNPSAVETFIQNATDICLFFNYKFNLGFSEKKIWEKHYRVLLIRMCAYSKRELLKYLKLCLKACPASLWNKKVFFHVSKRLFLCK